MQRALTEALTRAITDSVDQVTLRTRADALRYIDGVRSPPLMAVPWGIARNLLMAGAEAEAVTSAIELALIFEARLDVPGTGNGNRALAPKSVLSGLLSRAKEQVFTPRVGDAITISQPEKVDVSLSIGRQ